MRTALIILGSLALILALAVTLFITHITYIGGRLDASSKAYVDKVLPRVFANWSQDEIVSRASPEFRASITDAQLHQFLAQMMRLGSLKEYEGSSGSSNIAFTTSCTELITASYVVRAVFKNGRIVMQIKLIQQNGEWMIYGLHVDPQPSTL